MIGETKEKIELWQHGEVIKTDWVRVDALGVCNSRNANRRIAGLDGSWNTTDVKKSAEVV
jgi:hypothetical protein